jgi:hypothetical protein
MIRPAPRGRDRGSDVCRASGLGRASNAGFPPFPSRGANTFTPNFQEAQIKNFVQTLYSTYGRINQGPGEGFIWATDSFKGKAFSAVLCASKRVARSTMISTKA